MILTQDKNKNVKDLRTACESVYGKGIMADLCWTQGVHESNLLGKPSQLAMKYNNLFGIKGKGNSGKSVSLPTWEEINGKVVKVNADFASNDSIEDSVKQHQRLMQRPRYSRVRNSKTLDEAFKMILACGYATDARYSQKLSTVYQQILKII